MRCPELEGAGAKLDRAREHVIAQKVETDKVTKGESEPLSSIAKADRQSDRVAIVVTEVKDFGPLAPTIIGDALYDFRCVLDHIAWLLVKRVGQKNLTPSEERQIQFPIYKTWAEYDAELDRRLRGARGTVEEAIVRRYQPYTRGNGATDHPFALLAEFSNTDKHRNIHPVLILPTDFRLRITYVPPGCLPIRQEPGPGMFEPLKVGAEIQYVHVRDIGPCLDADRTMEVETKITAYVAFRKGAFIDDTLGHIDALTTEVLDEFDRIL